MIGGIGSAMRGVALAAARFDQAAVQVSAAAAGEAGDAPDAPGAAGGVGDAMVAMAAAQFAMLATFHAARASNEMIMQALDLGNLGHG